MAEARERDQQRKNYPCCRVPASAREVRRDARYRETESCIRIMPVDSNTTSPAVSLRLHMWRGTCLEENSGRSSKFRMQLLSPLRSPLSAFAGCSIRG